MVFSLRILGRLAPLVRRPAPALLLAGAALLAGCGQKGPLFLPVPPRALPPVATTPGAIQTPTVPTAPASAASAAR